MTLTVNKSFRKLLLFFCLCLLSGGAYSQKYGNEWIDYSRQYYKFPIYKEAIYRIDSAQLASVFNLSQTDPKDLQLIFKGKELALFVQDGGDNKINNGDYIEFYAHNSTAEIDSLVYSGISYVPNRFVPLYNDTIYAFLSINTGSVNKRYVLETDTSTQSYPSASFIYSEKKRSFDYVYNTVRSLAGDLSDPRITQAEAWGHELAKGASEYSAFAPLNAAGAGAPLSYFTISFAGKSTNDTDPLDHHSEVTYLDLNGTSVPLFDTVYKGFVPVKKTFTINTQNLGNGSEFFFKSLSTTTLSTVSNSTALYYFHLLYPRNLNLAGLQTHRFYTEPGSGAKRSYHFASLSTGSGTEVALYDVTNQKKIPVIYSNYYFNTVIPGGTQQSLCFISGGDAIIPVTKLTAVKFNSFSPGTTSPYVVVYHPQLASSATNYKSYRESIAGGSYKTVFASIIELYDQFSYGLPKHPLAIRNFVSYLSQDPALKPISFLLIGTGAEMPEIAATSPLNLIPTIGSPSSDNLLAAKQLSDGQMNAYPEVPIGRIAASINTDVEEYLKKIQQHESTGEQEWKKKILHFVGGADESQVNLLSSYMEGYKEIIEDTLFGGKVRTFKKTSTAPIQLVVSDSIKMSVNAGASLLTFFGHGSTQGFDQSIDDPDVYNNIGKYPFILANSCYSGFIHNPMSGSVSKRFLFAKQKGSIGFLASNTLGFTHALDHFSREFYKALSVSHYGKTIGEIIQFAAEENAQSGELITKLISLDMTLHGDPAVRIGNGALPDYRILGQDLLFEQYRKLDTIIVEVNYRNIARAVADSFAVLIERFLPAGDTTMQVHKVATPYYNDKLTFYFPIDQERGIGLNKFRVTIDFKNEIKESNENNNSTGFVDVFIQGNDITPVYPYKYAVVPKSNVITLKASTTDPFAGEARYLLQLDTTNLFISPIQSTVITSKGGVLEWSVNLILPDSGVYYWRTSRDSISPTQSYNWKTSSFQTIGSSRGWGQAHFYQFLKSSYQFITPDLTQRSFVFNNRKHLVSARTGLFPYINPGAITYFFNNDDLGNYSCSFNGWNFVLFDKVTGLPQPLLNPAFPNGATTGPFNNCLCDRNQKYLYAYYFGNNGDQTCKDPNWQNNAMNFLNSLPADQLILAYTTGLNGPVYSNPSSYSNGLYTAFESIGSGKIRTLPDTVAAVIFGRKGMLPGQAKETLGATKESIVTTQDTIRTKWNSGTIASEIIGPSYKWNSLHWRMRSLESVAGDTTILKIVGIKRNGEKDTLHTFLQNENDVVNLQQYADAEVYPYLQLVAFVNDRIFQTSPQLVRWQVLFDEAPECALNPLKGFSIKSDSLQEGDDLILRIPIENVGPRNFEDSLVATYWIEDNDRRIKPLPDKLKSRPFVPGQILIDTVKVSSMERVGKNALWISVNPVTHTRYQTEQYQFNNIGRYTFTVTSDITNPLLDVTFDGKRILNGEIVSAKPVILITLKDENKFLALNDTSDFTVMLQTPGQNGQRQIYFGEGLQFTPARLPKNSASIVYTPTLITDGKYMLTVQATDRSRNMSGTHDYQIQFEVDNKPAVTNVLNYPNPFSTSTRFVFTLTGSEIPEVFTIQIMTVTGKLVKEITRDELGSLRIGNNITDYAWDGRDQYGDRLANGVYLYRVRTKLNGENIDKRASGADPFFTKEFGKMVLMR